MNMNKKILWYLKIAGLALLVGGLLFSGPLLEAHKKAIAQNYAHNLQPVRPLTNRAAARTEGVPVAINLPHQSIHLAVAKGFFNASNQTWTLSNDKAYFATPSALANNQGGNTFIYGHDIAAVFLRLNDVKNGDMAQVTTDNGHLFTYQFRTWYETSPTDVAIFAYNGPPILTLQTCSGIWSENRKMLVFDLVEAH